MVELMPWDIGKDDRCPASKPWAVTNADTNRLVACHASRDSAIQQQRALYANVPESRGFTMDVQTKTVDIDIISTDDTGNGTWYGVLSDESLDRDGEELLAKDWLPLADKITFDTDHGMDVGSVVGSAVPQMLDDGRITVSGEFSSLPRGQETRTLLKEGHIDRMSVAYRNVKQADGSVMRELLNGSFVAIPSNPEAKVLAAKSITPLDVAAKKAKPLTEDTGKSLIFKALQENGQMLSPTDMIQAMHDMAYQLGAQCDSAGDMDETEGMEDKRHSLTTVESTALTAAQATVKAADKAADRAKVIAWAKAKHALLYGKDNDDAECRGIEATSC